MVDCGVVARAAARTVAAACWGTIEANEILLQASELPQRCFDIHLTPREE